MDGSLKRWAWIFIALFFIAISMFKVMKVTTNVKSLPDIGPSSNAYHNPLVTIELPVNYRVVRTTKDRYDGAFTFHVVIAPPDISSVKSQAVLKQNIKNIIKDIVRKQNTGKLSIKVYSSEFYAVRDNEDACSLLMQRYNITYKQAIEMQSPYIVAHFSGELSTMPWVNTLSVYPAMFADSGYPVETMEFNPNL